MVDGRQIEMACGMFIIHLKWRWTGTSAKRLGLKDVAENNNTKALFIRTVKVIIFVSGIFNF